MPTPTILPKSIPQVWLWRGSAQNTFQTTEERNMAVFRVERTRNYTVMSNYHLRDKRLSLKAKACCPKCSPCRRIGITPCPAWPHQLRGQGRDPRRCGGAGTGRVYPAAADVDKDGKFGNNEYIIREYPVSAQKPQEGPPSAFPSSGFPTTEEPSTDLTSGGYSNATKYRSKKEKEKTKN